ncbi:MAG: hypothetical protein WC838_06310 [Candidatus Margulisiibacteriota bacterium]|jgi:hypothetical protein
MYKKIISGVKHSISAQTTIGIGETEKLSLRVSTAVLAHVVFTDPATGESFAVLERKAKVNTGKNKKDIQAQPLGGGSRLKSPQILLNNIGEFNYDNKDSRDNGDFRVYIAPAKWALTKKFCLDNFREQSGIIETSVERELAEEFLDALGVKYDENAITSELFTKLRSALEISDTDHSPLFTITNIGTEVESESPFATTGPLRSTKLGMEGISTQRVYNIQHVAITHPNLIAKIKTASSKTNEDILTEAERNAARSSKGEGKATSLLIVPQAKLEETYKNTEGRAVIDGHVIADNVPPTIRYKR